MKSIIRRMLVKTFSSIFINAILKHHIRRQYLFLVLAFSQSDFSSLIWLTAFVLLRWGKEDIIIKWIFLKCSGWYVRAEI